MFGMDAGLYPLSETESRLATKAIADLPQVCIALSNHTYTGALLTQPYHADPSLGDGDIHMMQELAEQSVEGTDYRVIKVYPDFAYNPKKQHHRGLGRLSQQQHGPPRLYTRTVEPFSWAGVEMKDPASFFGHPDPQIIDSLMAKACEESFRTGHSMITHNLERWKSVVYLSHNHSKPTRIFARRMREGTDHCKQHARNTSQDPCLSRNTALENGWYSLSVIMENHGFCPRHQPIEPNH